MQKKALLFKSLIILIAGIASISVFAMFFYKPPHDFICPYDNRPTLGSNEAKVKIVVFEDVLCPECIYYSNHAFPLIKMDYIDTGLVHYTMIPLCFLGVSDELTQRLICLYHKDANRFWQVHREMMLELKNTGQFKVGKLEPCSHPEHRREIDENNALAEEVMGEIVSPAIYIDGEYAGTHNYYKLKEKLDEKI
ncbi:MAG: thioredoxin domain-containing protein [Simkaniaceae bacterium]|nr:thioredoxin domain-containing protein [Simkaniaceae bacterium]